MLINGKQKKFIAIGIAIMILMGIFPPWKYTFSYKTVNSNEPAGYGFILLPPAKKSDALPYGIELDTARLFVQWIIVTFSTGLGVFLAAKPKGNDFS